MWANYLGEKNLCCSLIFDLWEEIKAIYVTRSTAGFRPLRYVTASLIRLMPALSLSLRTRFCRPTLADCSCLSLDPCDKVSVSISWCTTQKYTKRKWILQFTIKKMSWMVLTEVWSHVYILHCFSSPTSHSNHSWLLITFSISKWISNVEDRYEIWSELIFYVNKPTPSCLK